MTKKALILDPLYEADRISRLKDLARQELDWTFVQLNFGESQRPPNDGRVDFYNRLLDEVRTADIILGFGDYTWFKYCSGMGSDFVELMEKRLVEGCPFYLQLIRTGSEISLGQLEPTFMRFLRRLEIIPSDRKVFSRIDSHLAHQSGGSVWFNKDDKSILNPQLFKGINRILISQVNTVDYVGDVFPIVQIGPTHFEVDSGDNLVNRPLGDRAAVAVERRTDSEFAIVICGEFSRDPVETLGGVVHGIDENEVAVRQILFQIDQAADAPDNRAVIAFREFSKLERALGSLIQSRLVLEANGEPIHSYFPERVLKNTFTEGRYDYSLANYSDLILILSENWHLFSPFFDISKSKIKAALSSINFGPRRHIAHPHKALLDEYKFPESDLIKIRSALTLVLSAYNRMKPTL
ncbi:MULTISPECIES: hypothetical protein [Marivita]|uniref:Uncharacterized protein n=1 Tax=Marivita cryptomonadis TaxID=505252 RepID=A0A9Q2RZT9_9RHOB|nr:MULTISPECIES: hypothetical protein [Marivita]MCR9170307.1 hypothetical protein [Paracoccaceae bacterium]MBM2324207.1 hypothetical protein [Marivita cryptomonadis]MBM2333797.1 hypothetical protein [Marivita cryptomonadis]MBM2343373.1 hypothetical protein [Marivita cryptomonadis]MBM2348046.1 hypothetical protein [Marivita cryptomonadis]